MNDFHQFATSHGLIVDSLIAGRITRCSTVTHPHKRNGALYFDGEWGWAQDWSTMPEIALWKDDKPRTPEQQKQLSDRIEASRVAYAKERKERQLKAAAKAEWILSQAEYAPHDYLKAKGFKDEIGLVWHKSEDESLLCIPMKVGSDVVGVQMVDQTGSKRFLTGQRCSGAEFVMGNSGQSWICEGYATGLSLRVALRGMRFNIHIAFSAGNMAKIAVHHPDAYIVADHDLSGTGERIARSTGLPYWMPPEVGHDFNDFARSVGVFQSSQAIKKFLTCHPR